MEFIWYDSNFWLIEMGGQRILFDFWLVGDLIFGNMFWLFWGFCFQFLVILENIDLILFFQGLEDYVYFFILKELDKSWFVFGFFKVVEVVIELGYEIVIGLFYN